MARFEYYDLNCPHCKQSTRVRFEVVQSYSNTSLQADEFTRCHNHECRQVFSAGVETRYVARKLQPYQERRLQKKLDKGEII